MKVSHSLSPIGVRVTLMPLIDTLTLTFLFITLSGNFLFRPAVRVGLPVLAPTHTVPAGLNSVTVTGREIFFNGRRVEKEGLEILLKLTAKLSEKKREEAVIILKAGENVSQGRILEIIRIAWKSGIKKVAIATEER